jgi:hypothetical protein
VLPLAQVNQLIHPVRKMLIVGSLAARRIVGIARVVPVLVGSLTIIIVGRLLKELSQRGQFLWKGFFGRDASGAVKSSTNAAQHCPEISSA